MNVNTHSFLKPAIQAILCNDLKLAELQLQQIIKQHGENGSAHGWYGICLMRMNKLAEANESFQKAIAYSPLAYEFALPHYELTQRFGNQALAEHILMRGLIHDPQQPDLMMALGRTFIEKGEIQLAAKIADEVLETCPESEEAKNLKGYAKYLGNGFPYIGLKYGDVQLKVPMTFQNYELESSVTCGHPYQQYVLDGISRLVKAGHCSIIVGAGTGYTSQLVRHLSLSNTYVTEIHPAGAAAIQKLVADTPLASLDMTYLNTALADGRAVLRTNPNTDIEFSFERDRGGSIQTQTLDSLNFYRLDFILYSYKTLCEEFLKGATQMLQKDKPSLLLQVERSRFDRVCKYLDKFGYIMIGADYPGSTEWLYGKFVHKDKKE